MPKMSEETAEEMTYIFQFVRNAGELIIECIYFAMYSFKYEKISLFRALNDALIEWDSKTIDKIHKIEDEIWVIAPGLKAVRVK